MITSSAGSESIKLLFDTLTSQFGYDSFQWTNLPGDEIDNIGWRLNHHIRYLFSISTYAGAYPDGQYELQVSIIDDSLENGEIVLLEDVDLDRVCEVVAQFAAGEIL